MRAVIQRVDRASVEINHQVLSSINKGILVLLGVEKQDTGIDADYILEKAINLRIFEDEQDKMNRSLLDIEGANINYFISSHPKPINPIAVSPHVYISVLAPLESFRMSFFSFLIGPINFGLLLAGTIIIFIAWIMDEGRKIQEEQELTV